MLETWVRSLDWEDPLEEPNRVFLPGEFPWREEPGGLQSMRSQSLTALNNKAHSTRYGAGNTSSSSGTLWKELGNKEKLL